MNILVLLCALVAGASATNRYQGLLGYSGIVRSDGNNVQFTREQADNILLVGPSGAVTKDGKNMQLIPETHRTKRSNYYQGHLGYSGIVKADGNNVQFTREQADNILLVGPSGAVTKDGKNMQLIPETHRTKRSNYYQGHLGYSGIVRSDGNNVQFTREQADNILLVGPSGAVTKDGKNMQLIPETHRTKRSNYYQGHLGYSGIVRSDGNNVQFTREQADNILLVGPSGAVTKDGKNMQLIPETHRTKRSNYYQGHLGYSGIVKADGNNVQFTREQADNILLVGPSGAVTKDGKNMQLIPETHRTKRSNYYQGHLGYSGIVRSDGNNVQFTREQADNILLVGPSGAVTKDGKNMQLIPETHRTKRSNYYQGHLGYSGIVKADGNNVQFTREQADNILLVGPSGAVTKDGKNMQLVPDTHRTKRSTFYQGLMGHSGIVKPDGNNVQFTREQADNIVLVGPSGVVTRDGRNMQRIPDDHRVKRGAGYVNSKGSIGYSGIVKTDGTIKQFSQDDIDNIVLFGPSGVVTKDGRNWQLDEDLNIHRTKRHLIGASGMITKDGTPVQFKEGGAEVLLEGPSGIIMSDGTLVQLRS